MNFTSLLAGATLASMAFAGGAAQASIITFDDVPAVTYSPISGGYSFSPDGGGFAIAWPSVNPDSDDGTQALIYGYGTVEMQKAGGGTFSVSQLESGLSWYTAEVSLLVTATGTLAGGGTVTDTYTIGDGYETYDFSNLNNLTSLTLTGSTDGYVAVDNISVSSGVPEPGTWAMMLLGLAGLGFVGYRRASGRGVLSAA